METTIKIQKVTFDPKLIQFVVQSFDELFREGTALDGGDIGWHFSYDAVVAYWADEIVGAILFVCGDKDATATLVHGFVRPEYRRRGIYTQVWLAFVEEIRKRGAVRIYSQTHTKNVAMRTFWLKTGRPETFVSGSYKIPAN